MCSQSVLDSVLCMFHLLMGAIIPRFQIRYPHLALDRNRTLNESLCLFVCVCVCLCVCVSLFFSPFILIAVLKLLLFSVFQMRIVISIYQTRLT